MGEGKKRVLRKSALVFDDPLEAYERARKVSVRGIQVLTAHNKGACELIMQFYSLCAAIF